jgi:hypothetical protein
MVSVLRKATLPLIVFAAVVGSASAAGAAQPAAQACVGQTYSQAAAALPGGDLGQTVRSFAQDPFSPPGLGDGIQALQAGLVPDDVVINACN